MSKILHYRSGPFATGEDGKIKFSHPITHLIISIPEAAEMHLGAFELNNVEYKVQITFQKDDDATSEEDNVKTFIIGHTGILEFHNNEITIDTEAEENGEAVIIKKSYTMKKITAIHFLTKCSNRASISYIESESE